MPLYRTASVKIVSVSVGLVIVLIPPPPPVDKVDIIAFISSIEEDNEFIDTRRDELSSARADIFAALSVIEDDNELIADDRDDSRVLCL